MYSEVMSHTAPARIAYLAAEYPAVSHTFILREVAALRRLGLEVETCSIRRTDPVHHKGDAEAAEGKRTFHVLNTARNPKALLAAQKPALTQPKTYFSALRRAWGMRAPGIKAALYQLIYFAEATVLARHLQTTGITHLHGHFANASATVTMLAAELADIPFSFTLHGPSDLTDPARWRLDLKVARAAFVSCISYYARSQAMLAAHPDHWDKLKIIHCGVEPSRYAPAETPNTAPEIVFVGRLAAVKGVRLLFDAFQTARETVPDLRLTLVGDGPDRAALETAAAPLGDAVTFAGYQTQDAVADILARSDMMVLPSFAEGVPVVLMEAMASQIPVIATRVAGVAELVQDGTSGFVLAPGDVDALARAIVTLAQNPARRTAMGQAGRAQIEADFAIDGEAHRLAALFRGTHPDHPRPDRDTF
ncbi:MAG: glycosyltransferase family 4 protein [Paracoccaceae bacterium]